MNDVLMRSRPVSLTIAAWLFILVGGGGILLDVVGLVRDAALGRAVTPSEGWAGLALIWAIRALAVLGGVYVLRGANWARWLLAAWMVLHVGISLFHSVGEAAAHVGVFSVLAFLLFRPAATAYVRGAAL